MLKNILSFAVFFLFVSNLYADQFDTSIVAYSTNYNYKNPNFERELSNNSNSNYITLAYERWDTLNSRSNIIVRKVLFENIESELILTNDNFLNTNPSVSHKVIMWQSNRNSDIDLYYSKFDGSNWSSPLLLESTPENESNPGIDELDSAFYIVYQREEDIFLKVLYNGHFILDTNLTATNNEPCFNPKLKIFGGFLNISYLTSENSLQRIVIIRANINSDYTLTWLNGHHIILYSPGSIINFTNSETPLSCHKGYLNYNYETQGMIHTLGIYLCDYSIINFTENYSGNNINGVGTLNEGGFPPIKVFGWQRIANDSSMIVAKASIFFNNYTKSFYLGNSTFSSKLDVSESLSNAGGNVDRVRLVWERKINNRYAIIESRVDNLLTSVNIQNSVATDYNLKQNFPNPFNPSTTIKFYIPRSSFIKLKIFNSAGKEITTIISQYLRAGEYEYDFNASELESGIYFYQLVAKGSYEEVEYKQTRKMVFLK